MGFLLLAHGNDPAPLPWHELLSDVVVALMTFALALALGRFALLPLLKGELESEHRNELLGWGAIGLAVMLGTSWWIVRQSLTEAFTPPASREKLHLHSLDHGGQMAMFGDYHAEVVRMISGEYRLWLTDAYGRQIGPAQYQAWVIPRDDKANRLFEHQSVELEAALQGDFRLGRLPREVKSVQVQMALPGITSRVIFNYVFDGKRRPVMSAWCGPAGMPSPSPR